MTETASKTKPKPRNVDDIKDASLLLEGRYGTRETCDIWGTDADTYMAIMDSQVAGLDVLKRSKPVPDKYITALKASANFGEHGINPDRVRELEAKGGHDVIAVNTAWGEAADKIEPGASSIINYLRTSADSTETAKAIRSKRSLIVFADSVENLRDITLEKSMEWRQYPHIDQTHLYDALPTMAGRPFSFFGETLQSDLDWIRFVHDRSLMAKWADATGNHHSADTVGVDGMELQQMYAESLGLNCMTANAQIPAREFNADIMYALARTAGTMANLSMFLAMGFGDDCNIFYDANPNRRKGSSGMPHKDVKGGNRTTEEQAESLMHEMAGKLLTSYSAIKFRYGRDLSGSASDRLDVGPAFKFCDHVARRLALVVYHLGLNVERARERVGRTYGVVTSERVLNYLVDPFKENPMPRKEAHDLLGRLATRAYTEKRDFYGVLLEEPKIVARINPDYLRELADPMTFIGQSVPIIERTYERFHGKKTFSSPNL